MSDSDSSVEGEAPLTSCKRVAKPKLWKKTSKETKRLWGELHKRDYKTAGLSENFRFGNTENERDITSIKIQKEKILPSIPFILHTKDTSVCLAIYGDQRIPMGCLVMKGGPKDISEVYGYQGRIKGHQRVFGYQGKTKRHQWASGYQREIKG
ncbi:hypothetical protein E2C01_033476 [Portunus trituberculatus]|uniref:Uncharacterized protein n=1 Tax=Portunus trituberculatus TaxID=210409 RepID=A0A5B7F4A5_PORTR|nr:hypothetical protein [Portunus trituberculatus]